jgi:hypothetical protein
LLFTPPSVAKSCLSANACFLTWVNDLSGQKGQQVYLDHKRSSPCSGIIKIALKPLIFGISALSVGTDVL